MALAIRPSLHKPDRATTFNFSSGIHQRNARDDLGLLRYGQFGIDRNGDGFVNRSLTFRFH